MRVFGKKGGVQGRKIRSIMIPITKTDAIDVKRECIIKALCVYLNEEPENLVKEYMNTDGGSSEAAMMETTFGIFVIRKEGAEPGDGPEDVGIVLESVQVLDGLGNVPLAVVMLFALVYALNLSYPPELRYTFEALQKIIMELDGNRLSIKKSNTENSTCTLVTLNRVNYRFGVTLMGRHLKPFEYLLKWKLCLCCNKSCCILGLQNRMF
ncbi:PREDICTED: uncharacterized protein LOC107080865 [Cyprinodon variegatus]|uniref:uncharacterized protein LOC107080865 n=1 Tax=Cyprinodon variegatus TaxID=28743 RepID=UPI00074265AD|nr:PREDICTED: uncharacterized protein LOC107080865 [Cyprinodon variegatus]